jgi:hypothetical protein
MRWKANERSFPARCHTSRLDKIGESGATLAHIAQSVKQQGGGASCIQHKKEYAYIQCERYFQKLSNAGLAGSFGYVLVMHRHIEIFCMFVVGSLIFRCDGA